jgi:acyl dehydratase
MNLDALQALRLAPIRHSYTARDSILYALGLGYGDDPADPAQLKFLYEKSAAFAAVPSICVVLAHPGFWVSRPELGIDWLKILHGEQGCEVHAPIAPEGVVRGEYDILAVEDKGAGKGAVMHVQKKLYDDASDRLLATVTSTYMLRGDGGQGGFGVPQAAPPPLPDAVPDTLIDIPTLPQAALTYRLSGDFNPIHVDPAAAAKAGFPRPVLHGLCTFGIATRGLIAACAGHDPSRIAGLSARFSKPVFPGETIRIEVFGHGELVQFRARAVERDLIVLDRGQARIAAAPAAHAPMITETVPAA